MLDLVFVAKTRFSIRTCSFIKKHHSRRNNNNKQISSNNNNKQDESRGLDICSVLCSGGDSVDCADRGEAPWLADGHVSRVHHRYVHHGHVEMRHGLWLEGIHGEVPGRSGGDHRLRAPQQDALTRQDGGGVAERRPGAVRHCGHRGSAIEVQRSAAAIADGVGPNVHRLVRCIAGGRPVDVHRIVGVSGGDQRRRGHGQ